MAREPVTCHGCGRDTRRKGGVCRRCRWHDEPVIADDGLSRSPDPNDIMNRSEMRQGLVENDDPDEPADLYQGEGRDDA